MTLSGACFRQEADGKLYVRYQVIGRNHVAVPTHFFKVRATWCQHSCPSAGDKFSCPMCPQVLILEQADGKGVELRSYVLPNEPISEQVPLERFLVPIETIERMSGLLFVPNIMKRTAGGVRAIADR